MTAEGKNYALLLGCESGGKKYRNWALTASQMGFADTWRVKEWNSQ